MLRKLFGIEKSFEKVYSGWKLARIRVLCENFGGAFKHDGMGDDHWTVVISSLRNKVRIGLLYKIWNLQTQLFM